VVRQKKQSFVAVPKKNHRPSVPLVLLVCFVRHKNRFVHYKNRVEVAEHLVFLPRAIASICRTANGILIGRGNSIVSHSNNAMDVRSVKLINKQTGDDALDVEFVSSPGRDKETNQDCGTTTAPD
jgi:hypothetical protein